jgi:hypothetical protein
MYGRTITSFLFEHQPSWLDGEVHPATEGYCIQVSDVDACLLTDFVCGWVLSRRHVFKLVKP